MKRIVAVIIIVLIAIPVLAAKNSYDNLNKSKEQVKTTLNKLKDMKPKYSNKYGSEIPLRQPGTQYSSYSTSGLSSGYYNKTAQSPYTKAKIGEGLLKTAIAAAFSIGTSQQDTSALQLRQIANDLKGSGIPEYNNVAGYLNNEADCIDQGDSVCAQTEADKLRDYLNQVMPKISASYKPTNSEKEALNPFGQFLEGFVGSVISKLADWGIAQLLATIGLTATMGPMGTILSIVGLSVVENLGDNAGTGGSLGSRSADALTGTLDNAFKGSGDNKTTTSGGSGAGNSGSKGSYSTGTGNPQGQQLLNK